MIDWNLAANVTLTGVVLVFSMLVALVLVLIVFGKISEALQKSANKKAQKAKEEAIASIIDDEDDVVVIANDNINTEEIVAVISAAVSSMYFGTGKKPVIKSISKSAVRRSAWANAGISQNTKAF